MTARRNNLILVALILVAMIGALLLMVPGSPLRKDAVLGLDLQGGYEVVLKAETPPGRPLRESDLERSADIIRNRIDKLGVAEPEIRTQDPDQISVELPGVDNPDRVADLIGSTAQLELYDFQPALTGPSVDPQTFIPQPSETLYDVLSAAETQTLVKNDGAAKRYLFETKTKKIVAGPMPTRDGLLALGKAKAVLKDGKLPSTHKVFALPKQTVIVSCGDRADFCPPNIADPARDVYYLFKHNADVAEERNLPLEDTFPQMTGNDLRLNGTRADIDPTSNQPVVLMQFTDQGADKFHDVTRAEAQRGRQLYSQYGQGTDPQNWFQQFAIVLDDELITAPTIDFEQNPDGIPGTTGAQIEGVNDQEARDIALVLQTGALPVEFVTLSQNEISATLGEDSLRQALRAALIGLLVVAVFLLVFYRFLGLVAVIGLAVYAVFLYAMILLFNVTLTLPGFAGMILTVGVAADANIVIFERIKEEARAGKSVRAAISSGYAKGFATIIDANVVTAITAVILFVLATSGVRGFALMLLLGTGVSIVTAVFATRAMLGLLSGFRWFDNPAFMGASAREIPAWQRVDIVGRRRVWFTIASVLIGLSILSIAIKGLNLGIDFRGGTETEFSTPRPVAIEDVRTAAERVGMSKAVIQGTGASEGSRYREFQVKTEPIEVQEQRRLENAIEQATGATAEGARTVSASFSGQILRSAIIAMIFAFILISLYVTIRFQWRFAVPILRTIANDGLIAIGVYSISGREVSASTVAAFLTIVGYSIYDTIIIFDRVRENLQHMRRGTIKEITNISLWETIPRSLATTFITLLPVAVMFFFGGETLKDFAFAILVGIGVSAFSTIFIAAPFLAVLMERHPAYRGRRDEAAAAAPERVEVASPALVGADGDGARGDGSIPDTPPPPVEPKPASSRDRRRQRRRSSRPHGRAR